jgi:hypothetical protein
MLILQPQKIKSMEISGKLFRICPAETGEGRNGTWRKQTFVIETVETYPKQIAFNFFGDRIQLDNYNEGDFVKVQFELESREYQGKWFTDARSYKLDLEARANNVSAPQQQIPPLTEQDLPTFDSDADGDLPF